MVVNRCRCNLDSRGTDNYLRRLAATLGSKSAFKKLPKRSVMTADISQLCRLIATPAEPLALRLSSNLLVGAARWVTIVSNFMQHLILLFPVYTEVGYSEDTGMELTIGQ